MLKAYWAFVAGLMLFGLVVLPLLPNQAALLLYAAIVVAAIVFSLVAQRAALRIAHAWAQEEASVQVGEARVASYKA
jgi:hypothetical protein